MMKYKLVMSDEVVDETVTITTEAEDVFDAINKVTKILVHPGATKLITAYPIDLLSESMANASVDLYKKRKED